MFFFPYFAPVAFYFLSILLIIYLYVLSIDLSVEFSFVILVDAILLLILDPVPVSVKSPFFPHYFLVYLFQVGLSFLFIDYSFHCTFENINFLDVFVCSRYFFIFPNFIIQ